MAEELKLDRVKWAEGDILTFYIYSYLFERRMGSSWTEEQWWGGGLEGKDFEKGNQNTRSLSLDCKLAWPPVKEFSSITIHLEERAEDENEEEEKDVKFGNLSDLYEILEYHRNADNGKIYVFWGNEEDQTEDLSSLDVYLNVDEDTINTLAASVSPSCEFKIQLAVGKVLAPHKARVQEYEMDRKFGLINTNKKSKAEVDYRLAEFGENNCMTCRYRIDDKA